MMGNGRIYWVNHKIGMRGYLEPNGYDPYNHNPHGEYPLMGSQWTAAQMRTFAEWRDAYSNNMLFKSGPSAPLRDVLVPR